LRRQLTRAMRVAALSLIVLGLVAVARGEDRFAHKFSVYVDDDETDVVTAAFSVAKDAWRGGTVSAHYSVDVVSSASVDVVSNASPRFDETRHAASLSAEQMLEAASTNRTWVGLGYGFSVENDYSGHAIGLNLRREIFRRNTVVSAGYELLLGDVRRSGDESFSRSLNTHSYTLGVTQVLSRSLVGSLTYLGAVRSGFNASPYLYARIGEVAPGLCRSCPEEVHPDLRVRHTVAGQLKQHIWAESAVEGSYSFYVDSWAMIANTAELRLHLGWTPRWGGRLRYRFYHQRGTSFYEDVYSRAQRYMTGDRELGPMMSNLVGLKGFWRFEGLWVFDSLALDAKIDLFQYDFFDFARLPRRRGLVTEAGIEGRF